MKNILLLGANGFLGHYLLMELVKSDSLIKCVSRSNIVNKMNCDNIEYLQGDISNKEFLISSLKNVDIVYYFVSTTFPSSNNKNMFSEIDGTARLLDFVLQNMVEAGAKMIVFPSSGGAIYGSQSNYPVVETTRLQPSTPYGVGKEICESIISFYCRKYGMNAYIFRIGNVYGSSEKRNKKQGVIDIFIQHAINDEPVQIWKNAEKNVRDYIYIDDMTKAIIKAVEMGRPGINIYNLGTGKGSTLVDIIKLIEKKLNKKIVVNYNQAETSGIGQIILDSSKLMKDTGWSPSVDIDEGITLTIEKKRFLFNDIERRNET